MLESLPIWPFTPPPPPPHHPPMKGSACRVTELPDARVSLRVCVSVQTLTMAMSVAHLLDGLVFTNVDFLFLSFFFLF